MLIHITEFFSGVSRNERVDDGFDLAVHKGIQGVERQSNAVVCDSALREIIGADAFASVARADLTAALIGDLSISLRFFNVIELCTEQLHRFIFILELAALLLTFYDDTARFMNDADSGFGLIDVLTARAAGFAGFDLKVGRIDHNVHLGFPSAARAARDERHFRISSLNKRSHR